MFYSEEEPRVIGTTKDLSEGEKVINGLYIRILNDNNRWHTPTLRCFAPLQHDKWYGLFHIEFSNNAKTVPHGRKVFALLERIK